MPATLGGGSDIPALAAPAKDIARIVETIELLNIRSTPTGKRGSGKEPLGICESGKDSPGSERGLGRAAGDIRIGKRFVRQ